MPIKAPLSTAPTPKPAPTPAILPMSVPAVRKDEDVLIEILADGNSFTISLRPTVISRLRSRSGKPGPGFDRWLAERIQDHLSNFAG